MKNSQTVFASIQQACRRSRLLGFSVFLLRRFGEVRVPEVSASLTFTTLLSLVPMLTVVLAVVSAFPMFERFSETVVNFIQLTIVPQGADALMGYLDQFKQQAGSLTAIGIIFLGVTSLLLIRTIDQTFNRIWSVKSQRPFWFQFLLYWALLTFGPIALGASLSVWGILLKQSAVGLPLIGKALQFGSSVFVNAVILFLLYRLVPNRFVPLPHALIGAVLTAVLLELARRLFALYLGTFNSYQLIYGAFAAVPVFLIWLNVLWMLVLGGAVLTASLSYWKDEAFRRSWNAHERFDDVLNILLQLDQAQQQSRALNVRELRRCINLGYDELGDLLEKLARYDYVYKGKQGWVLKGKAETLRLNELFTRFVYRPEYMTTAAGQEVTDLLNAGLENLDISLAEFAERLKNREAVHS
ncbi:MAG: YihY family inner membrane protein [Neisseria sp.]|nr:YihY family inner membrane protein [Neisseria sp.]